MSFLIQPLNILAEAAYLQTRFRAVFVVGFLGLVLAACGGGGGGSSNSGGNPLSGGGGSGGSSSSCTTPPTAQGSITLSGHVTYDRVPTSSGNSVGLEYDNITAAPARGVVVQALACNLSVMASTVTDANGDYSFVVGGNVPVQIRVRAQLLSTSGASWNVKVLDNTSGNGQYVLDGKMTTTAQVNETRDLHAASGWSGSALTGSYSGTRAAAPFAILDTIYAAMMKVSAIDTTVTFSALNVFWSKDNQLSDTEFDTVTGMLPASFFDGRAIYLLGKANQDTDEYDDHVILHEWGHYIQFTFSRDDSLGGAHANISHLDARVAYSEGFGNAWSAIMSDDPLYVDTDGSRQSSGFDINIEGEAIPGHKGWFKEFSIQQIIYDFYDSADDGADAVTLGLAPIWQALTGGLANTDSLVTIFAFVTELKHAVPSQENAIDAVTSAQDIDPIVDAYGSGENNWAGLDTAFPSSEGNLAVYEVLALNGTENVCTTGVYGAYNGFDVYRYLTFTVTSSGRYRFDVDALNDITNAQPTIAIWRAGVLVNAASAPLTQQLGTGTYVIEVFDARNTVGEPLGDSGIIDTNIDVCFAVSVAAS